MKTVIRVEHPSDGQGMWNHYPNGNYDWPEELYKLNQRHNKFNSPKEDGLAFIKGKHYCSFKSIDQIQQWITKEEFTILIGQEGFRVYMIDLSYWMEGRDQIIFSKEDILQTKDISDLFL